MIKNKITKILVPINNTKNSIDGLEMAISIAKQSGAAITCVYVTSTQPRSEFGGSTSANKAMLDEAKSALKKADDLVTRNNVKFNSKILHGDVGYAITKMAHDKKHGFDLLVIGVRKRGIVKQLFLGSVSNYIVHSAKIPVLVVK